MARSGRIAWVLAGWAAAAVLAGACAAGNHPDPSGNASAGAGAAGGSSGEGGSEPVLPCGIDCAKVKTDDCHVADCNMGTKQCEVLPVKDGKVCDDGKFCTTGETCHAGLCNAGKKTDCGQTASACHEIACDETAKSCMPAPLADGIDCVDP